MTPSARLSAAIEILADIEARRRPAADVLKDWGLSHRFAGSGDRAALAGLVYDTLRRRASARWLMDSEAPRASLIGMLVLQRGETIETLEALFTGERFAPEPLTEDERKALAGRKLEQAAPDIQADVPNWLWASFEAAFGEDAIAEGRALAERAPVDLRVNTLKATRDKLLAELEPLHASATPLSRWGVRVPLGPDGRSPAIQAEESFQKGWFEIQDEGSQLAGLVAAAKPGEQVLDLCAGGGGKTLEFAAAMENKGQIFATDSDKRRLAPIHDRLARAGIRNVQVRTPRGGLAIDDLDGRMDLVLVDAPCSGSGTWRRNPDTKWRMRPSSLADRQKDQAAVLKAGARAVKPGGRLVFVTCSVLPEENDASVKAFLADNVDFTAAPLPELAKGAGLSAFARFGSSGGIGLQLSPLRSGTDGFFIALLHKK
ncbi:RsmB/NOP family class I SAM-dependent RNA methyltransferase [Labrys sp. ZIDIC5]|uniref:RsmB/NOP family class I SAM-dependent RNA methyltransferase n=1 Tax=Labrys sedimenti TaxID=3106036 RepID=UPI002ACAEBBB|nr:RsmB/NOP family class I SAM-dependent RNA methyltransferase [Labrys sp. ZIDIC5]MDZ5448506.1 RsmB/NOP family class I SAM-dependent RNA methyltransferase [Labrys sp. ZIDIC5]